MKVFPLLLLSSALAASVAQADTINNVSFSGIVSVASTPTVSSSPFGSSSKSKLLTSRLNNSTVLDAMLQYGDLSNTKGYTVVEAFNNEGTSLGLFAYNKKSGDAVEVNSAILASYTTVTGANAVSTTSRNVFGGVVNNTSSDFKGLGSSSVSGTLSYAYITGTTATSNKTVKINGSSTKVYYLKTSYSSEIRGAGLDSTGRMRTIDAKLKSSGGAFVTDSLS